MEILESKIPLPPVIVEEEEVKEEDVPVEVPKDITEEDYTKEMAAKIQEMGFLVTQVDILSPLAPDC